MTAQRISNYGTKAIGMLPFWLLCIAGFVATVLITWEVVAVKSATAAVDSGESINNAQLLQRYDKIRAERRNAWRLGVSAACVVLLFLHITGHELTPMQTSAVLLTVGFCSMSTLNFTAFHTEDHFGRYLENYIAKQIQAKA